MSGVGGPDEEQTLSASVHAKRFECGHHGIAVENGINAFHDVSRDIQEVTFVFERNQGSSSTIVHANLQGFSQGPDRLNIALNA